MNALFGLWQTDAAPVAPAEVGQMAAALDFWAPQSPALWRDGPVALGCRSGRGEEPQTGGQPIHDPAMGQTFVASARLINRDELAAELLIPPADLPTLSDGHLMLTAWQRWGVDCVHRLDGDWHFALWDSPAHRLFLARCHHGTSSLYYHHRPGLFAFASTQKPLLALARIPQQPNLLRIAQILGGALGDGSETGYAHIYRLPPAHCLNVDSDGLRVTRYWFPELLPEIHLDDDTCVEAFLHHYRRAVESRLSSTGKTALMLSGGLDSGSVAVLAAARLVQRGETLHAFTSVPVGPAAADLAGRGPLDEGPLAGAVAQAAGNIHLSLVGAEEISPLAGIERMLWVHDEPAYPAGNSYWLAAIYAAAQAAGVMTLLVGTAGNDTVSWRGASPDLAGLFWADGPGALVDRLAKIRARSGLSTGAVLWTALVKPLLRQGRARLPWPIPGSQPDWAALNPLHPAFAQRPEIAHLLVKKGAQSAPTLPEDRGWAAWRLDEPGRWLPPTFHFQDGGGFGLDVLDPTADRRLVEFCLAMPTAQYHNGAQDRWLIRRAMAGRLPDRVRLIGKRARQSADLVSRLHTHREEMESALTRLSRHPLAAEVLNVARLAGVMGQIGVNPGSVSHFTASVLLLRGLMVGLFLEKF